MQVATVLRGGIPDFVHLAEGAPVEQVVVQVGHLPGLRPAPRNGQLGRVVGRGVIHGETPGGGHREVAPAVRPSDRSAAQLGGDRRRAALQVRVAEFSRALVLVLNVQTRTVLIPRNVIDRTVEPHVDPARIRPVCVHHVEVCDLVGLDVVVVAQVGNRLAVGGHAGSMVGPEAVRERRDLAVVH